MKKIIDACQEEIKSTSTFPETDHLIKTREESDAMVLPWQQAVALYHMVEQLLFISAWDKRDTQTTADFLTTYK